MKEIIIKTWSCRCGYRQDFEPTEKNNLIHFRGLAAGTCPSCGLVAGLKKEIDRSKKSRVVFAEAGDKRKKGEEMILLGIEDVKSDAEIAAFRAEHEDLD